MPYLRLKLGPRLSAVSWAFIELFSLLAVFFLPFSKSVAETGIYVALVLWVLRKFPWSEPFPSLRPSNAAYVIFLVIVAASLLRVPHELMATGARGFFKWLKFVGIFFLFLEMAADATRRQRLVATFLASTALLTLNGFYQMWSGVDLVKHYAVDIPGRLIRMRSSLGSPNDLAAFLMAAMPVAFAAWLGEKRWTPRSALYLTLLALFSVAFILTFSRAAFLSLVLVSAYYVLRYSSKRTALALGIVLAVVIFSSETLLKNYVTSLNPSDITIGERLRFWQATWDMIRERPFFGNGVNMYYQLFPKFAGAGETYRGYAHNCYLQMWSEIGLFGLLAFLYPFVILVGEEFFRRSGPEFGLKQALAVSLSALLLQSFFDTNFYGLQTAFIFWMLWGVFASCRPKT